MPQRLGGVEGSEEFSAFVTTRYSSLLRFGYVLSGNADVAQDLVQDALERTGAAWSRITRKDAPEAYVRRAMVNGFTSTWRRRRREWLTGDVPELAATPVDPDDALWPLLLALPPRQRAVLVLRFYEDLSESETARVLGVVPGTVKSQTSKGLAALRTALTRQQANREATWNR